MTKYIEKFYVIKRHTTDIDPFYSTDGWVNSTRGATLFTIRQSAADCKKAAKLTGRVHEVTITTEISD